jgi:hypothetical protein
MSVSSPSQPVPGSVLADRFEILRSLGSGGMGAVYLARHRLMERLCAIKVLHPALARDEESLQRFLAEARNASRILHPNVCAVYDCGTTPEGTVYLAMEYVEGRSLGAILAEQGALPLDRAAALLDGIAAGLEAAHELGIVHRDLKPDNVMVVSRAGHETVKLVDFGIAKALARDPGRDLTTPGTVVGTPDYMAPEQFAGDPVDCRTDVYALGLTFYRMVTGVLPHRADTAREMLTRRLTEPPDPLARVAPDRWFPPGLQGVLDRALARRPEDRFARAIEFAAAVGAALAAAPVAAAEVPPTVRLDTATRRLDQATRPTGSAHRRRWALPVGLVALAATAVIALPLLLGRGADDRGRGRGRGAPEDTPAAGELGPPLGGGGGQGQAGRTTGALGEQRGATAPSRDDGTATLTTPPPAPGGAGPRATPSTRAAMETRSADPGPSAPSSTPTLPTLPGPAEINDPATREAARLAAETIYRRPELDLMLRASAAYLVADAYRQDGNFPLAEQWAGWAVLLVRQAPESQERADRLERYQRFLTALRSLRRDTISP